MDLVQDGVNGAIFPVSDGKALAGALEQMLRDSDLRRRMGGTSSAIIAHWSYAECLDGLRQALTSVGLPVRDVANG